MLSLSQTHPLPFSAPLTLPPPHLSPRRAAAVLPTNGSHSFTGSSFAPYAPALASSYHPSPLNLSSAVAGPKPRNENANPETATADRLFRSNTPCTVATHGFTVLCFCCLFFSLFHITAQSSLGYHTRVPTARIFWSHLQSFALPSLGENFGYKFCLIQSPSVCPVFG
jgi:hypothetical protein